MLRSILSLAFLCAAAVCNAQDFFPSEYPAQARLCTRTARDAGTDWYYTDLFLPVYLDQDSVLRGNRELLFFLNPKITSASFSQDEENLGAGVRYLSADAFGEEGFILGANLFYDSKYSPNGARYYQVGSGLEFLSRWLDLRGNYYRPLSDKNIINPVYAFDEQRLAQFYIEEEALPGFDLEAGVLVPFISALVETRIYGGGYWYTSTLGHDITGSRARLEITPSPLLSLNIELRDDAVAGSDVFFGCRVSIPFDIGRIAERKNPLHGWGKYMGTRFGGGSLKQRMTDPIVRDLDVVTLAKNSSRTVHDMIYVDNTNDADTLEDGSFSHPHNTLTEAFSDPRYMEGVWVYVRRGDGTADDYTGSYTLANRSALWGEGYQYLGLGGSGYPIIDGGSATAATAIALGQDNTVMGLHIQNARYGIAGNTFNTVDIHNNIITGIGGPLASGAPIKLIPDNATSSTARITNNAFTDTIGNGIEIIVSHNSSCAVTINDNTISNQRVNGLAIVLITNDTSSLNATISGNTLSDNQVAGLVMHATIASHIYVKLEHNIITGNEEYGIVLDALIPLNPNDITLDAGNGSLGSQGYNSIHDNGQYHIKNLTTKTVTAENNWWGRNPPLVTKFSGLVDYNPYLKEAPE